MSLIPIGRMENDKLLDRRVFVPFTDFYRLSLENIKIACEDISVLLKARALF